ncbi:tubulin-tyrosine ligase-like protein [Leptomonas pyrrhocoris]|uniref:Tubulin--tyrosine ligase n=1 Tax=Leptomonas pyrrhocoris TaxID=157538 RepID=A0A0N0DZ65_LEPPY|nr:tubulin-tyrosine ligase-like protein [Leptomonas pyrrhocoris]KPA84911.1 tubulin-tyrosine ligase-like protein [Leptomonas pyrrhocoris]|eukprot:XP_015663350.1 tubulin-tyrosine ligase-like protein [Leptomonas pyrrhocoris]
MNSPSKENQRTLAVAPADPVLSSRYNRANSASTLASYNTRKNSPRVTPFANAPSSATKRASPRYSQPLGNGRRGSAQYADLQSSPLPPQASSGVRSSIFGSGAVAWGSSLRVGSARGHTASAPLQRTVSATGVERRCKYVVATMKHCGSIYEEMTKQLLATGRWSHINVRQRSITKALVVSETQCDLVDTNVHLLLGEKMPCERVISTRREAAKRFQSRLNDLGNGRRSGYGPRQYGSLGIRMPMGNGDDGEPRLVDFVENTRSITLKSAMVTNLLKHHYYDWGALGEYLPMSFKLLPRQATRDDRHALLATAKRDFVHTRGGEKKSCMWITKSSAGCHGDNIEIFCGDQVGLTKLLRFVDSQRGGQPWIAQQYIDRPLLYHKRKFDIRCWALLLRDRYEIYVYDELVMRTSSVPYNRDTATSRTANGRLAHITNHCVQETGAAYSLYEDGNELWREHLDGLVRYKGTFKSEKLKQTKCLPGRSPRSQEPNASEALYSTTSSIETRISPYPIREVKRGEGSRSPAPTSARDASSPITLDNHVMPQIHAIVKDTLFAAKAHVPDEPVVPPTHTFQVFGYDFLIDEDLKVWLLEINGAPGGPDRLKSAMMKDTIEIAVAPFFPGTMNLKTKRHNGYVRIHP